MKLKDRVAVITGGGSGIGAEICRAFAQQGALVAVADLRAETAEQVAAEIQQFGGQARAWAFDVAERGAVESAANEVERQLGPNRPTE